VLFLGAERRDGADSLTGGIPVENGGHRTRPKTSHAVGWFERRCFRLAVAKEINPGEDNVLTWRAGTGGRRRAALRGGPQSRGVLSGRTV